MAKKKKKPASCWQCKKKFVDDAACQSHASAKKHQWQGPTTTNSTKVTTPSTSAWSQNAVVPSGQAASSKLGPQRFITMFACPMFGCTAYFNNVTELESHRTQNHTGSTITVKCQDYRLRSIGPPTARKRPMRHISSLTPPSHPFKCVACHGGYENENELREHLRQKNVCESCKVHYSTAVALQSHYEMSNHDLGMIRAEVEASQTPDTEHRPSAAQTVGSQSMAEPISLRLTASTPPSASHSSFYHDGVPDGRNGIGWGAVAQRTLERQAVNPPQSHFTFTFDSRVKPALVKVTTPEDTNESQSQDSDSASVASYASDFDFCGMSESTGSGCEALALMPKTTSFEHVGNAASSSEDPPPSAFSELQIAKSIDETNVVQAMADMIITRPPETVRSVDIPTGTDSTRLAPIETPRVSGEIESGYGPGSVVSAYTPDDSESTQSETKTPVSASSRWQSGQAVATSLAGKAVSVFGQSPVAEPPLGHTSAAQDQGAEARTQARGPSWHCRSCQRDPCNVPTATACGHIFCQGCILPELARTGCCPACKRLILLRLDVAAP